MNSWFSYADHRRQKGGIHIDFESKVSANERKDKCSFSQYQLRKKNNSNKNSLTTDKIYLQDMFFGACTWEIETHRKRSEKLASSLYLEFKKKIVFDCGGSGIQARKNNKDKWLWPDCSQVKRGSLQAIPIFFFFFFCH